MFSSCAKSSLSLTEEEKSILTFKKVPTEHKDTHTRAVSGNSLKLEASKTGPCKLNRMRSIKTTVLYNDCRCKIKDHFR